MSLIQEALRKAQKEREKSRESMESTQDDQYEHRESTFFTGKRKIIYSLLFLGVVVIVVTVTLIFKPTNQSAMKSIRRSGQSESISIKPTENEKKTSGETQTQIPSQIVTTQPEINEQKKVVKPQKKSPIKRSPVKRVKETNREKSRIKAKELPKKKKKILGRKSDFEELIKSGDQLISQKDFILAVNRYKKALKIEKRVSLYLKLYSAFRNMKNSVLAQAYIEEGLNHFPESFALNKISAILHIRAKKFNKSLSNIEVALAQNRQDYALLTYKGLCYFHKKNYENALLNLKESLDLNSNAVENYYYIGLIYDNTKNYKKAIEFYKVFFRLNPEDKYFKHRNWVINRIKALKEYLNRNN